MILAFDTETDCLVKRDLAWDHPSQPELVQLGAVLLEHDGTERACVCLTVPRDAIPRTAVDIHGIDAEASKRYGTLPELACSAFAHLAKRADTVVAHALDFDERVMATAFKRCGRTWPGLPERRVCTAEMAERILRLPPSKKMIAYGMGDKFKKPSLEECCALLFGGRPERHHWALADARDAARVYVALRDGVRPSFINKARFRLGWL